MPGWRFSMPHPMLLRDLLPITGLPVAQPTSNTYIQRERHRWEYHAL
jgi:hypothetical protein